MGRISQVNVNSTALDHTVITIVITNTGLIPTSYQSKIADCPDSLPESWVNATFPKRLIQPRRNQAVSLNLYGELPTNEFYCSVQLLNRLGEPVATRQIKVRKMDRCFCALHCLCVCVGDARGTSCQPMSLELYHAAGFRGPVPHHRQIISDVILNVIFFIVSLILLLLLIGLLKGFIGLYIPAMGRWGLDSLLETRVMSEYFERELKYKRVIRDEYGAPVHPDTRKRTVRICSRKVEFFLNTMFFLIFPFAVCCHRLKKFFRLDRKRCYSNESKISLMTNNSEHTGTICVNTYGDNRDSQMEVEDIKYVMDELKKSEESLRNHTRSKRNCCIKEYGSCH
ncbi:hapless 2 [Nylanderia fulva]|uniref:hapless 2 n=1 Tax=Nylanderia fulva TaxID=613905 RepID=UPI0010FBB728|nr:hapless 2 [Nylanderia fulva]